MASEVHYSAKVLSGRAVLDFLLDYVGASNNTDVGLAGASFVAREFLGDESASITHSHGVTGVDLDSPARGKFEIKVKKYLLSNRNSIVTKNVREYKRRTGSDENGLIILCPLVVFPESPGNSLEKYELLNLRTSFIVVIVMATHEAGQKEEVRADEIVQVARKRLKEEFGEKNVEEMAREKLLALIRLRSDIELLDQLENVSSRIDAVESKVDAVESKVDAVESKVDAVESKVDRGLSALKSQVDEILKILKAN
ncbi:MAG: hypothetical protein ACTSU5_05225 [Promethearchaeota archaeon]